ncbi:hypothetical protein V6N11_007283 [Hibiscus sabdariffa]|uniref:Uncharacterized protein n=1 Tax=Hibiscus sabdariffa TaxID=183260 RepID=A0ABR2RT80_9ROSI
MAREEAGLSLSATKGIIEVERPILSDGILPNIINHELKCFTLTLSEFHQNPKSERIKRLLFGSVDAYSDGSLSALSVQCMLGCVENRLVVFYSYLQ